MWDAFHGASLEAASVGGEALFRSGIGPLLPGTLHVPPPDPRRCPLRCGGACNLTCADYLDYVFEKEGDVGAVIAEPIRATTAMVPPPDYWRRVREACDRHGALLIFDEIPTGLGRLGTLFASEVTGVTPDIVVLGKGLGGGVVPMAAVVARAELDVAGDRAIGHYTHEKSPVGCAAANAVLDLLEGGLLQDASEMGGYLLRGLSAIAERIPAVAEARGVGMLFALEMHRAEDAEAAMYRCLSDGLSLKVASGTVLTLTPPLTLTRDEADRALDILGMSTSL
jgi:4-aminobutyrate aminotransferase